MKGKTNAHKSIRTSSVEFVTVNVTVPEGLTGYEVTITEVSTGTLIAKQTTPSETYKIPHGVEYYVEANKISGYKTPEVIHGITSQNVSTINLVYEKKLIGVFTCNYQGELGDINTVINNGVGVVVITDDVKFMLAPADNTGIFTGDNGYINDTNVGWNNTSVVGNSLPIYKTIEEGFLDYNGDYNSNILYEGYKDLEGSDDYGLIKAKKFTFKNYSSGRLPSLGEAKAVSDNLAKVKQGMYAIGLISSPTSNTIFDLYYHSFWTTTRCPDQDGLLSFYFLNVKEGIGGSAPANYLYKIFIVTSYF